MAKSLQIILIVIAVAALGYIIPVFLINDYSQKSFLEKDIRSILSRTENFFILAMDDDVNSHNYPITYLYTWFGIKYGSVQTMYGTNTGTDLVFRGLSICRFWSKKDKSPCPIIDTSKHF